jgi:MFS family permease
MGLDNWGNLVYTDVKYFIKERTFQQIYKNLEVGMKSNKTLKAADRKIFTTYFDDGLVDIFLAAFVLMFVIGPFLSVPLGDFWGVAIFLPFWGLVYLILRYLRRRFVTPRLGSVTWGDMRKRKLRTGGIIMLVLNVIFLGLGVVAFMFPIQSGLVSSLRFGAMILILFTAAGYFYDYGMLYVYGVLIALALPVGEWLYQTAGFSHHGYPVAFGSVAGIMLVRGLVKFFTILKTPPPQVEEQTV